MQCSLNKDHQHLKWRPQKSWTYPDFQDVQVKQLTQYLLVRWSKWKMHQRYSQIPTSECPDIRIRLPKHKWPKSWSSMEDPIVPLKRNLHSHPLAGLFWERQFEKVLLEHGWANFKLWMFICKPSKRTIPISVCGWHQTGRQNRKHQTYLENSDERRWYLEEPTSFLDHVYLGCTERECTISNDTDKLQRYVRIQDFIWSQRKTTDQSFREKQCLLGLLTWTVTQRNVWKDIANLQIKRLNNDTKSQRHAWMAINWKKKKMSHSVAILAPELSRSKWTWWQYQTTCFTGSLLVSCSLCLHMFLLWPHVSTARCWCIWHTGSLLTHAGFFFEFWFSAWLWLRPRWYGHPLRNYYGWKARCPSLEIRSMAIARTSSPSDLMTRLSQRGRRMPSMSCSCRDVFSFRFSCLIAYHTAPCANVSCPKKKKKVS